MLVLEFPLGSGVKAHVLISSVSHWVETVEGKTTWLHVSGSAVPLEVALTSAGIEKLIRDAFTAYQRNMQANASPIYASPVSGRIH